MRMRMAAGCLVAATSIGCGGSNASAQSAGKTAAALSGEDKLAAAKNPQCQLFTPAELAKYSGEPLSAGHDAAMGTGCQWMGRSQNGNVLIQVVPARYHEPHKGAPGFKKLPDIGTQGFVEQSMGGWNAGTITGPQAVVVSVNGPAASEANAIALLTETIRAPKVGAQTCERLAELVINDPRSEGGMARCRGGDGRRGADRRAGGHIEHAISRACVVRGRRRRRCIDAHRTTGRRPDDGERRS